MLERFGTIVKQIADRTYLVDIKGRQFKKDADDIIPRYCETEENNVDDSWTYEYPGGDTMLDTRNQSQPRQVRRYPLRERRPVDRYGISNIVSRKF